MLDACAWSAMPICLRVDLQQNVTHTCQVISAGRKGKVGERPESHVLRHVHVDVDHKTLAMFTFTIMR